MKELSSNEMMNKFIETANKVRDKVHAREFFVILKVQLFHCPYYIKETFLMKKKKSILYSIKSKKKKKKKKKIFFFFRSLIFNLENLDDDVFFFCF